MSFMRSVLQLAKGAIPERLVVSVLNKRLVGLAEILEFELDSKEKTGRVKVRLAGEQTHFTLTVGQYQFRREGNQAWLTLNELEADREWIHNLLQRFVLGKTFEIPKDKVELADGFLG